jgi:hypothetical protein
VDRPDPGRVDLVRRVAQAGRPELLPQLALEVGRGGIGVGDRSDVLERQRLGDALPFDRHAEQVKDPADDRGGLAGPRTCRHQHVLGGGADSLPL